MRVISGSRRGRRLSAPDGISTRPTEDRIKENVFNLLGPMYLDTAALDLFSGSGQMGIEFLSRGCSLCVFVDNSKAALRHIAENLKNTGFTDSSRIIPRDIFTALREISDAGRRFQYIYIDPPFDIGSNIYTDLLEYISEHGILEEDGIIIVESRAAVEYVVPVEFSIFKERLYREISIRLLKREV